MATKQGCHIGFCGIDGAGKTTQLNYLYGWLQEQGFDTVKYEESRNFVSETSYNIARQSNCSCGFDWLGGDLYSLAISFEVLRQNMQYIGPFTNNGITVVTSRTIFDWMAGSIVRECQDEVYNKIERILLFNGLPDITIWLDTDPEIAIERIVDRGYDEASLEYIVKFREALSSIAEKYTVFRVNGDLDVMEVSDKVSEVVEKNLAKEERQ